MAKTVGDSLVDFFIEWCVYGNCLGLIFSLNGAYMETMSGVDCFIEWCVYGNYVWG